MNICRETKKKRKNYCGLIKSFFLHCNEKRDSYFFRSLMRKELFFLFLFILNGCSFFSEQHPEQIVSIQVIDRNGFSETISNKERLANYQNIDFLASQPYQKVLRVFGKNNEGKNRSMLTSYHLNGTIGQYLEALDGRANGLYLEWHENGKLHIESHVIEGLADLSETAQKTWIFDQHSTVWDEEGNLVAEFQYDKGLLEGEAKYYHSIGTLAKSIPYEKGLIDGSFKILNPRGVILEKIDFKKGQKDGQASGIWNENNPKYQEQYREGKLINATYFTPQGIPIGEIENGLGIKAEFQDTGQYALIEYKNGYPEGQAKIYLPNGNLHSTYSIKNGKKHGCEWEYYPSSEDLKPKLMITWHEEMMQGIVKTWYENGVLESQKEMSNNKKHGLSFAYYVTGDLMLMEQYDNDKLIKGSYYQKGSQEPISIIEQGNGVATIYHPDGYFLQKILYEKSRPVVE